VNQKIDRTKNFIEAIDTPLATVLTLIFSIALGVSLSLLLSRSDTPSALVPTAAAPDHSEIVNLLARGRAYLSDGDVALARVFLRRAAERHDPQAALALGGTYDPAELKRIGINRHPQFPGSG
jgi:hypothetical protein